MNTVVPTLTPSRPPPPRMSRSKLGAFEFIPTCPVSVMRNFSEAAEFAAQNIKSLEVPLSEDP